ncbi:MAG: tetratricopeptide repeat protein [Dehalococcoidia bacterium]
MTVSAGAANIGTTTKLLIPRRGNDVICRQRLIDLLHDHIDLRAQVICAPGGYGKTTLVVDFTSGLDVPVCWYSLDASDQDPRRLLEGIVSSIRFQFPDFGQQTQSCLLRADDVDSEASHLVGTLTGEMYSAIPDYFVLVLEDYHLVEDSEKARVLLDLLVDRAPENCHILVTSRTPVELPAVSKLALRQRVATLGTTHLSFTPAEVKELLAVRHGIRLSDEEAEELAADTEGWVIGILISTYGLRAGDSCKSVLALSRRDVFGYLTQEVYQRQSTEVQRFLLASSTLDDMEAGICDRLLGIADSRSLLARIERQNLFVQHIGGEDAWYRYHHLFREFLQAKLLEEDPEQFALLHCRAASLFEQDERWNDAVVHYLAAKSYDEALRVIKTAGEALLGAGEWMTVSKWIDALPKEMFRSDPDLVLLRAQNLIHLGEVDEAARVLTDLLPRAVSDDDWLIRAKALSWRSAAFRLAGNFAEAKSDISAAIRTLKRHDGPATALGDAYRRLGNIHMEQGRFTQALRQMQRALKLYYSVFDVGRMADVHNSIGIVYKRLGDLVRANMHFEHAREGWQKVGNSGALAMTLSNIGQIYQRRGQHDLALDTLRLGRQKAHETGYRRAEALILVNIAEVLRDLDLYDDALAAYQEGLGLARQVMETYYVMWAKAGMGETYRLLGERDKAEVLLKEAICQAEEQDQVYEASLFTMQLGIIEYERRRYQTAIEILQGVHDRLAEVGDKDALAKACFHLAQAAFLAKEFSLAANWLEEVSELADDLGYDDFLAVEGKNAALLMQFGASEGIGDDRFVRAMEKIKSRRDGERTDVTARKSGNDSAAVKPDIEVQALGGTRVSIDSRPIGEAEWRSSRAKEMFFYLLCCGIGQTKEQIAAALWPDLSPVRAYSNFHINLYRARRALFPGAFLLEHGQYKLNRSLNIRFDVADFERLVRRAEKLPEKGGKRATTLEEAVELYDGPFLEEFYSEWTETRRRELEDKYLKTLSLLANLNGSRGEYGTAIAVYEKFITTDPYNDEVYCQMMQWHLATGDKVSALRVYQRYRDTVAGEVGFAPSARMRELRTSMAAGRLAG